MGQYGRGFLTQHTPRECRAILAQAVLECDGKLVHVAHQLGYSRRHLYRLVDTHRMWPLINKVRIEREQRVYDERKKRY